jgi:proliferating cell nuclear antigen PCNA
MTVIFRAKTKDGYILKVLSELLQNNIRIACLEIKKTGIQMRMMDSHRHVMIDLELFADRFNIYELMKDDMYVGVNLTHFYKMIKSVKKKDALMLSIDDNNPDNLILTIFPRENNRITKSHVKIKTMQHIMVSPPTGYSNPVIIPSGEYQRTLKDMNSITGSSININMKKYSLTMSCWDEVYSREVLFGEFDDDTQEYYRDAFNMEQFLRTIKISGFSKNIQIFSGAKNRPLLISSQIGDLGKIDIYMKSIEQIRMDGCE